MTEASSGYRSSHSSAASRLGPHFSPMDPSACPSSEPMNTKILLPTFATTSPSHGSSCQAPGLARQYASTSALVTMPPRAAAGTSPWTLACQGDRERATASPGNARSCRNQTGRAGSRWEPADPAPWCQCRAAVVIPFCQALAPAVVAALACAILRFMTALGGSCCASIQRLMALNMAVPVIPMPAMLTRPPVATRAKPTIMALEFVELTCMPVIDDRVLVIVSPDVCGAQVASVPACAAGQSPSAGEASGCHAAPGFRGFGGGQFGPCSIPTSFCPCFS